MSEEELKKWEGKMRLYFLLHGYELRKAIRPELDRYSMGLWQLELCPRCHFLEDGICIRGKEDKVLWVDRTTLEMMERTFDEAKEDSKRRCRCVEWVRHV